MNNFLKTSQYGSAIDIENIFSRAYEYDISLYSNTKFRELDILLPHTLRNAVTKRKAEYLAGRFAARETLKSMHFSVKNIGTGHNRSPIWPDGLVASITHSDKIALCIASHAKQFKYLGVDFENILTAETTNRIKYVVIDQHEERLLQQAPADFSILFTVIFSAKESVFKALHPYVKRYFDFSAAKLHHISLHNQTIEFILAENLCTVFPKSTIISGRFYIINNNILSIIYKQNGAQ